MTDESVEPTIADLPIGIDAKDPGTRPTRWARSMFPPIATGVRRPSDR